MKLRTLIMALLLLQGGGLFANMITEDPKTLFIFFSNRDLKGWKAALKGKVMNYSPRQFLEKEDLLGRTQEKSKVTIRLYNNEGIREGETLFLVNERNLVVCKLTVISVIKSTALGYLLTGYGNFRLGSYGDRVVQLIQDEYSKYAYIHKARGDYYLATGETGKAMNEYKKAIELDKGNPEAHLAMGTIYFSQGMNNFAFREFHEAYKRIVRLYDNDDKYQVLKGLAEVRYRDLYFSRVPAKFKSKYLEEGIQYAKEALTVYPESVDANYYLGIFNYKNPEPDDRAARDYFLTVLKLLPEHKEANLALSELYFKHRNREKSRKYAEQALKIDPASKRARDLLQYLDK